MACNTNYVTDEEALRCLGALVSFAETPNVQDGSTVHSKKRRTESPLPLLDDSDDSPDHCPAPPPLGMTVGSEIKKLIVSTIVNPRSSQMLGSAERFLGFLATKFFTR